MAEPLAYLLPQNGSTQTEDSEKMDCEGKRGGASRTVRSQAEPGNEGTLTRRLAPPTSPARGRGAKRAFTIFLQGWRSLGTRSPHPAACAADLSRTRERCKARLHDFSCRAGGA